jgi:4'-phosphopantetheinyl transferase
MPKHYIDRQMRLHAGALHIWRADLDAVGRQIERLLDELERERAARIVREPARRRWIAARGVLRMLLGAYLGMEPSALRFAWGASGKPKLALPEAGRLRFSLSHSGGLAVYALTEIGAVGVDVELVRRRVGDRRRLQEAALARRLLGGAPDERLRGLDARAQRRELLRAWVRREAEGKRLGVGVRNASGRPQASGAGPWIAELELGQEAVGAVALASAPVDFQVNTVDFRACRTYPAGRHYPTREYEPDVPKL